MQHLILSSFFFATFLSVNSIILIEFGRHIDNLNPKIDDGCGAEQKLSTNFNFYGAKYSSFWVCNNGFISFSGAYTRFVPVAFPMPNVTMIAPFWADLDNRPGDQLSGDFNHIYWRLDKSIATLRTLAKTVRDNSADRNFKPDWAIVATWFKVGYYNQHFDLQNTFQILSCEAEKVCYCFFSYDQIQWTDIHEMRYTLKQDSIILKVRGVDLNKSKKLTDCSHYIFLKK